MPWIVGGAMVAGGLFGSSSSKKAAKSAENAAKESAKVQWDMYNTSREDMAPWRGTGQNALSMYAGMLGVPAYTPTQTQSGGTSGSAQYEIRYKTERVFDPAMGSFVDKEVPYLAAIDGGQGTLTPEQQRANSILGVQYFQPSAQTQASQPTAQVPATTSPQTTPTAPDYSAFYKSPGYDFRLNEGINALDRSAAARGRLYSGAQMKGINNYAQGVASEEYNNYANRLAALAGVGQTAATNTASLGAQTAGNVGNALMQGGQARASGYLGQANAWGNVLNQYMMWKGMNQPNIYANANPYIGDVNTGYYGGIA